MLPLTRDSTTLTVSTLAAIEADATSKAKTVTELAESPNTIYVAFAGSFYAQSAAHLFYWILRQLTDKTIYIQPIEAFLYHTLAYHEETSLLVLFAEPGAENIIARTADAARITETRFVIVSTPLPDIIAARIGKENLIEVISQRPSVHYMLLAAKSAAYLAEKFSGIRIRVNRLLNELSDISYVYDSLINRYKQFINDFVEAVKAGKELSVYASTTMLPTAYILSGYIHRVNVYPVSSLPVHMTARLLHGTVLAMLTDVEADILKEARFKLSMYAPKDARILELALHTDPLTAPLYGLLVVEHAIDRIEHNLPSTS